MLIPFIRGMLREITKRGATYTRKLFSRLNKAIGRKLFKVTGQYAESDLKAAFDVLMKEGKWETIFTVFVLVWDSFDLSWDGVLDFLGWTSDDVPMHDQVKEFYEESRATLQQFDSKASQLDPDGDGEYTPEEWGVIAQALDVLVSITGSVHAARQFLRAIHTLREQDIEAYVHRNGRMP
jgi:hypothetical protein